MQPNKKNHHTKIIKMQTLNTINRIAIFIDFDNFISAYTCHFSPDDCKSNKTIKPKIHIWESLNDKMLNHYKSIFPFDEKVKHVGTWLVVAKTENPGTNEKKFLKKMHEIDNLQGYIVKYGYRTAEGKQKGVDTEIVCQMLVGAFRDEYDTAILMSDSMDYIPVVHRVQDFFGKRVIQAGFGSRKEGKHFQRLRASCFGHIPLELGDEELAI